MTNIITKLQQPLDVSDIDFRADKIKKTIDGYGVTLLAYKDARVDMKRLDEATGGLWQNKYERDSQGILQCGIGIKIEDEWIWKWSNGVASNFEKEKGEYSDAFKRAGFMWGIGRELYAFPKLDVKAKKGDYYEDKAGNIKISYDFEPNKWRWEVATSPAGVGVKGYDNTGTLRVKAGVHIEEAATKEQLARIADLKAQLGIEADELPKSSEQANAWIAQLEKRLEE